MHCVIIKGATKSDVERELSNSRAHGLLQGFRLVSRPPQQEYSPAVVKVAILPRSGYVEVVTSVESGWPYIGVLIERCGWTGVAVRYLAESLAEVQVWKRGSSVRYLRALLDERWTWFTKGAALAFEEPDYYRRRRIKDRLPGELIDRYLRAMGFAESVKKQPIQPARPTRGKAPRG